jgi:hypothetical protein
MGAGMNALGRLRRPYGNVDRVVRKRGPTEGDPERAGDPRPYRLRRDRIDGSGAVTLRHDSRLHHIKVGRRHAGTRVLMLVAGLDIRIVTEDGELLRTLTLDPSRSYQPLNRNERA